MIKGKDVDVEIKRVKEKGCEKGKCKSCLLFDKDCIYNYLDIVHKWQEEQHRIIGKRITEDL